ncbi:MAG: cytidine deaminase [Acidobacteria bacterium]|nr:MAG: cytidine deaminase [Acidobacteriota bacterium]
MDSHIEALLEAAWQAEEAAYAPYSRFKVGAAILSQNRIFSGCNVENASYGLTVCAERHAIASAITSACLEPGSLDAVLVAVRTNKPTYPCGACRQVINEFANQNTTVYLSTQPGHVLKQVPFHTLLPSAFGPGDLSDG